MAVRPFLRLVIFTIVCIGRPRLARVNALRLNRSPEAVRRPWKPGPYQVARPVSTLPIETGARVLRAPREEARSVRRWCRRAARVGEESERRTHSVVTRRAKTATRPGAFETVCMRDPLSAR